MMPVTTISATPLSANGTVSTGWIYIADGLYSNVGVVAGADTTGTINILFSADGSTTLVEMTGLCNTSNIMNNGVMVQGVLQYGGYSNYNYILCPPLQMNLSKKENIHPSHKSNSQT